MPHAEPRTCRRLPRSCAAAFSAGLLALALMTIPVEARDSDPIRNNDPEQPIPPDQIENPIYYTMPVGHAGDVTGVVPEALLQEFLNRHSSMDYPAAIEAAMRLVAAWSLATAMEIGPAGPPVSAISPSLSPSSQASLMWGA